MDSLTLWYLLSFFVHFGALAIAVGAGVCDAVVNTIFWRRLRSIPEHAAGIAPLMGTMGTMAALGAALSVLSGLSLLAAMHLAHWGATWLNLKLVVFALLTVNGVGFASSRKRRVAALMPEWVRVAHPSRTPPAVDDRKKKEALDHELRRLERHLRIFHITENLGFVLIIVLAVFKFN
jgi:uncharacterized membrane protein